MAEYPLARLRCPLTFPAFPLLSSASSSPRDREFPFHVYRYYPCVGTVLGSLSLFHSLSPCILTCPLRCDFVLISGYSIGTLSFGGARNPGIPSATWRQMRRAPRGANRDLARAVQALALGLVAWMRWITTGTLPCCSLCSSDGWSVRMWVFFDVTC